MEVKKVKTYKGKEYVKFQLIDISPQEKLITGRLAKDEIK